MLVASAAMAAPTGLGLEIACSIGAVVKSSVLLMCLSLPVLPLQRQGDTLKHEHVHIA
jgi:hypothetical protein